MIIKYLYNALSAPVHSIEGDWRVDIYLGESVLNSKLVYCRGVDKAISTALNTLTPNERYRVTKVIVELISPRD